MPLDSDFITLEPWIIPLSELNYTCKSLFLDGNMLKSPLCMIVIHCLEVTQWFRSVTRTCNYVKNCSFLLMSMWSLNLPHKWAEKQFVAIFTLVPTFLFYHLLNNKTSKTMNLRQRLPAECAACLLPVISSTCSLDIGKITCGKSKQHDNKQNRKIALPTMRTQMLTQTHIHTKASGGYIIFAF